MKFKRILYKNGLKYNLTLHLNGSLRVNTLKDKVIAKGIQKVEKEKRIVAQGRNGDFRAEGDAVSCASLVRL